jgi:ATP-dependent RNA helicase DeaD
MGVGSSKTAAFALPIIQRIDVKSRMPKALILAPTRELAIQVSDAITSFCAGQSIRILSIYGGTPYRPQLEALKRGVSIVVGTPGRILDLINKGGLKLGDVEYVGLDEADEMLDRGFKQKVKDIFR